MYRTSELQYTKGFLHIIQRVSVSSRAGSDLQRRRGWSWTKKEGMLSLGKRYEKRNSILGEQHIQPGSMTDTVLFGKL